ncbi:Thioredoxin domain [Trinorchestia longiramus]|nr:Thioredoxin domain [Trinorchestia longiramus]
MATNYKVVADDSQFTDELNNAGGKLVVVDFTSARCPPCQRIAPTFASMGERYRGAVFLSVDIQTCPGSAQQNAITATPTFIFFRNKTKLDSLSGGDPDALEARIQKHYSEADQVETRESGVAGHIDLLPMISKSGCECLNQNSDHPYTNAVFSSSDDTFLESDADEQVCCVPSEQVWVVLLVNTCVVLLMNRCVVLLVNRCVVSLVNRCVVLLMNRCVVLLMNRCVVLLVKRCVVLLVNRCVVLLVNRCVVLLLNRCVVLCCC